MSVRPELAISVEGLGKRYRIGVAEEREETLARTLAHGLVRPARNLARLRALRRFGDGDGDAPDVVWALRDVSFELERGEVLGVIGRNGAGKSTLLKILARITHPSTGRVDYRGRVASLLEVGTGFHPDLTGRDNIFLSGTMLGMKRREIERRFDEIVEFSEISKFIETPVKRYSSGMYVRLAFAVAAHLESDVLLTDEVLAVGDTQFQRKCLGKMREVAGGGRTVIFVSHDRSAVASLCTRALWLDEGRVRAAGTVDEAMQAYLDSVRSPERTSLRDRSDRSGDGRVRLTAVEFRSAGGDPVEVASAGEPLEIAVEYEAADGVTLRDASLRISFENQLGQRIATLDNALSGTELAGLPPRGRFVCRIPDLPLTDGEYLCTLRLKVGGATADKVAHAAAFGVDATRYYPTRRAPSTSAGSLLLRPSWTVEPGGGADPAP